MACDSIISWQIDGGTMETVTDFIFWTPISLQMVTAAMKFKKKKNTKTKQTNKKNHLLLGRKAMTNLDSI